MVRAREALAVAEMAIQSATAKRCKVVVYLEGDQAKYTRMNSPKFVEIECRDKTGIIGVYTHTCDPEWIKDDIIAASGAL